MTPFPSDRARRAAFAKKGTAKGGKRTTRLPKATGPKPVLYVDGSPVLLEEFLRQQKGRISGQQEAAIRRLQPGQGLQVGKGLHARIVLRGKPLGVVPQPILLVDGEPMTLASFLRTSRPKAELERVRKLQPGGRLRLGRSQVVALPTPVEVPEFGHYVCLLDGEIMACPAYLDDTMDLENLGEVEDDEDGEFEAAARRAIERASR